MAKADSMTGFDFTLEIALLDSSASVADTLANLNNLRKDSNGKLSSYGYITGQDFSSPLAHLAILAVWYQTEVARVSNPVIHVLTVNNWYSDVPDYPVPFDSRDTP